jgi:hypothetical protein
MVAAPAAVLETPCGQRGTPGRPRAVLENCRRVMRQPLPAMPRKKTKGSKTALPHKHSRKPLAKAEPSSSPPTIEIPLGEAVFGNWGNIPAPRSLCPTTAKLVLLATALTKDKKLNHGAWKQEAREALELCHACNPVLLDEIAKEAHNALEPDRIRARLAKIPMPERFPVSGREFLRLVVGRGKEDRRNKAFKTIIALWWRLNNAEQAKKCGEDPAKAYAEEPSLSEVGEWFGGLMSLQLDRDAYRGLAYLFLRWEPLILKLRSMKAARKRWDKESP